MGRPARFNYDDVSQVCVDLDRRGILSADKIIAALGGGSKTTILRHYNRWLNAKRAAARLKMQPLEEVLLELKTLKEHLAHARQETQAVAQKLEHKLSACTRELGAAHTRIGDLESVLEHITERRQEEAWPQRQTPTE